MPIRIDLVVCPYCKEEVIKDADMVNGIRPIISDSCEFCNPMMNSSEQDEEEDWGMGGLG